MLRPVTLAGLGTATVGEARQEPGRAGASSHTNVERGRPPPKLVDRDKRLATAQTATGGDALAAPGAPSWSRVDGQPKQVEQWAGGGAGAGVSAVTATATGGTGRRRQQRRGAHKRTAPTV